MEKSKGKENETKKDSEENERVKMLSHYHAIYGRFSASSVFLNGLFSKIVIAYYLWFEHATLESWEYIHFLAAQHSNVEHFKSNFLLSLSFTVSVLSPNFKTLIIHHCDGKREYCVYRFFLFDYLSLDSSLSSSVLTL